MTALLAMELSAALLFSLLWLGIVVFLRLKKRKDLSYLLFFTIFYIYLFKVLDYTLFQFQSLLILKHFLPNLVLRGQAAGESLNLIPLANLTFGHLRTSLLNILMMVPFGFGLPFISPLRMTKVVLAGALFSVAIELMQLLSGFVAGFTFRIADINDVIFNTAGVAIGYILFVEFVRGYRRAFGNWDKSGSPTLRYIAERPQIQVG